MIIIPTKTTTSAGQKLIQKLLNRTDYRKLRQAAIRL
jgi:hypothetical protein